MIITKNWLKEQRACKEGCEWALKNAPNAEGEDAVKALIKAGKIDWANWLVVRLMTHKQKVQYAIYAAKQVIGIYEKKYPDDKRPREAIEAAKNYLKNPCHKTKNTATAAANAAADAYAANAANAAAYAAAYAAYAVANAGALKTKIIEYGLMILRGRENE